VLFEIVITCTPLIIKIINSLIAEYNKWNAIYNPSFGIIVFVRFIFPLLSLLLLMMMLLL